MKEDLLHYIWQQKVLVKYPLATTTGKTIEVVKTGSLNRDAGPDFFDARIRIDGMLWAGNVEIHLKSSDWVKHRHHTDEAYRNVILHVVFEHDTELGIPTLELKNYLQPALLQTFSRLRQSALKVPCENQLSLPDPFKLGQFLSRLAIERLEEKCTRLEALLYRYESSWEKLFYVVMARYFGMQVNAEPFIRLAENLPVQILARHRHSPSQVDALVFGVAGFLPAAANDEYIRVLNREFDLLKTKYNLPVLNKSTWKFARTRPANFPTVRLAQFAALVFHSTHLFSRLMRSGSTEEAFRLLNVQVPDRLNPGLFHHAKYRQKPVMGEQFLTHLLINGVVPVKFLYGKHSLNESLCEQTVSWLETLPPENNSVSRFWKSNGIRVQHALHSQALIQLNNHYCTEHKCLDCVIGHHILYQHA